MTISMYTLFDRTAKSAGTPFLQRTDAAASRQAAIMLQNEPFKNDFMLLVIADFDTEKCTIVPKPLPHNEIPIVKIPEVSNGNSR